jgi:hypothetical protein
MGRQECATCEQVIEPRQGEEYHGACKCSTWHYYEEGGWYHLEFMAHVSRLRERAESHISRRTTTVFDVCSEHGQMLDNVQHMEWLVLAVMDELEEWR